MCNKYSLLCIDFLGLLDIKTSAKPYDRRKKKVVWNFRILRLKLQISLNLSDITKVFVSAGERFFFFSFFFFSLQAVTLFLQQESTHARARARTHTLKDAK